MMTAIAIGRIGRAHGTQGEVTLEGCPLSAHELLELHEFTWQGAGGTHMSLVMESARPTHDRLLVRFEGFADRGRAATLARGQLLAEAERLPDPGPGVAYAFQLIGLRVETEDGRALGTLADIMRTGANPVYVVRGERELLVPATEQVVRRVDLGRGVITVALPAGLEEL